MSASPHRWTPVERALGQSRTYSRIVNQRASRLTRLHRSASFGYRPTEHAAGYSAASSRFFLTISHFAAISDSCRRPAKVSAAFLS